MITGLCGNRMIVVDDRTHDRAAGLISHMPHVVATALVNELVADPERDIATALAAGSWRDMTRVALDPIRTAPGPWWRRMTPMCPDCCGTCPHGCWRWRTPWMVRDVTPHWRGSSPKAIRSGRSRRRRTDILAHAPERIVELPEHGWQTALTDLARRGEHIVRFDTPRTVVVRELSHIG